MDQWNRQLKRLVWRNLGKDYNPSEEMEPFFNALNKLLDHQEKEYALLNRIMDLSSDELFAANTELRKRNEELDQFVYSTSHDLRAPLTSVMGLLDLIDLSEDESKKEKYISQIKQSTLQLDSFIQEIVAYTQNKKVGLQIEAIDFKTLVEKCLKRLEFMNNDQHIKKSIDIYADSDFHSDNQRLDNLLSNLFSNAIKYFDPEMPDPFLKVRISVENSVATIVVEDNGIGIEDRHHARIFDMFYRASSKSKGSGIGLYIVKEIMEKLNGKISLTSKIGEGSSFELTLPDLRYLSNGDAG